MGVIKVLDREVAELIAAGEVVERPASIVKELVENSLDAGADKITVEIKGGGIKYIRISDNGCGIAREDIEKAFVRHATSKISVQTDLERILTFGFRGEALASIAAVCEVELTTRTSGEQIGSKFMIKGSNKGEIFDAGCPVGTTFIIRNVFFNTPARLKFLKKDSYEGSNVVSVLEKLAMINTSVSFKVIKDGAVVINTPGNNDLKSAVHSIMGRDFSKSLIDVAGSEGSFVISGFITEPVSCKATRAMENFYINRRFVKSKTCMAALEEAYKGSVMTGRFPGCVLNIDIPADTVDVNVHPAKTEVRFSDEKAIYDLVFSACRLALQRSNENSAIRVKEPEIKPKNIINEFVLKDFDYRGKQVKFTDMVKESELTSRNSKEFFLNDNKPSYFYNKKSNEKKDNAEPPKSSEIQKLLDRVKRTDFNFENKGENPKEEPLPKNETNACKENYRIIGELFCTYILVEKGNSMFLIDKHAAHERYIYNQIKGRGEVTGQYLLEPLKIQLEPGEIERVKDNMDRLDKLGYGIALSDEHTIVINMIPSILTAEKAKEGFMEICKNIYLANDITPPVIEEIYHSIACRSAVKANDFTGENDLKKLVDIVINDEDVSYCPHGRPVIIEFTKNKIERMFGRIV